MRETDDKTIAEKHQLPGETPPGLSGWCEERVRVLLENLQDVIVVLDANANIVYESASVERVLGLKPADRIGRSAFEFIHPDDMPLVRAVADKHLKTPGPFPPFSLRFKVPDGTLKYLEVRGANLQHNPAIGGVVVTLSDVTDRELSNRRLSSAMAAAEAARNKLDAILSALGDGVSIQDPEYRILYQNERHKHLVGNHAGERCYEAYERKEVVCDGCPVALSFLDGQVHSTYRQVARPEGPLEVEITASCVRDAAGGNIYGIELVRDVSQRHLVEKALAESEKNYRQLFERNMAGVYRTSLAGRVMECNDAFLRIIECDSISEAHEMGVETLYRDPGERAAMLSQIERCGAVANLRLHLRSRKGRAVTVLLNAHLVREGADVPYIEGTLIDITELEAANETNLGLQTRLQQTQKMESMGILAGGLAHDFNNLLVGIMGNSELALMDERLPAPLRDRIEQIRMAAIRASELTGHMLSYAGQGPLLAKPLDLNALVEELAVLMEASVSRRTVIRYSFSQDLPPLEADPVQLRQIVMSLILNASQALGNAGGLIQLGTAVFDLNESDICAMTVGGDCQPGRYLCLSVSDTGGGISPEVLPRIFDPFFSTRQGSRGLGLAVTLGIVRRHHGAIQVLSEAGRGTRVEVFFPAFAGAIPVVPDREESVETGSFQGEGVVLLVDGDHMVREVASAMLGGLGYHVISAADGQAALDSVNDAALTLNAVLLDLSLGDGVSWEAVARQIEALRPNLPVVLLTGGSQVDLDTRRDDLRIDGVLRKPFRRSDLIRILRSVTKKK